MDYRKLILGLSALCVAAGLLLVCFSPGGFLNRPQPAVAKIDTPFFGEMTATANAPGLSSGGPVCGFILTTLGMIGFIIVWSMKPQGEKPAPLNL